MCNQKYQRNKNRDVSPDSPFKRGNLPPAQYLNDDYAYAKNPTKIDPIRDGGDINKIPLAGRLTEVGEKILKLGSKKAPFITTLNWGFGYKELDDYNVNLSGESQMVFESSNQLYGKFNMILNNQKKSPLRNPKTGIITA